ncbi:MAG: hypothetical protein AB7U45_16035 [Desulfamplus sp.]
MDDDDFKRKLDNAFGEDDYEVRSEMLGWDEDEDDYEEELNSTIASNDNNTRGGSSLKMECPHCGKRGEFKVQKTLKGFYHWNPDKVSYFKEIAGSDISYRQRIKKCTFCGETFNTIEMARDFLFAMMNDIQAKDSLILKLTDENMKLKEIINDSLKVLNKVETV